MKIPAITIIFMLLISTAFAQSNYFKSSYGFGLGPNYSFTDVEKGTVGYSAHGVYDYHLTPFVTIGVEGQYGLVQGGNIETDKHNRQFINKYTSLTFNGKLMLGEIEDYYKSDFLYDIRGLYIGLGVGFINNNLTDVVRYKPNTEDANNPLGYEFPGKGKSMNLVLPINLGFNYYIEDGCGYMRYVINFNAQMNNIYGEGLDGYNDPTGKFKNSSIDRYSVFSVGFRYFFGKIKVYNKTL